MAIEERMATGVPIVASFVLVVMVMLSTAFVVCGEEDYGWGPAELIENNTVADSMFPDLAMNEDGDAVAAWRQSNDSGANIWANMYNRTVGWGNAELIVSYDVGSATEPYVAIDNQGNAIVIWSQWTGSHFYAWTSLFANGAGWSPPHNMNESSLGSAVAGTVAFDDFGNALAIWLEFSDLYSSRYVPGVGWGNPQLVESQLQWNGQRASVGFDRYGNAVAVWACNTSERYDIWSNRYTVGLGWGAAELLETNDSGDAFDPVVGVDDDGNALAVWRQSDLPYTVTPNVNHIWSNRYVAGIGWGTPELRENNSVYDAYGQTVAMFGSGDAIVAWYEYNDSWLNVWTSRFSKARGWGPPEPLDGSDNSFSHHPRLAVNKEGRALIVWQEWAGFRSSRCTVETAWTNPETVLPNMTAGPQGHAVGIDGYGNGLAVWFMNDSLRYGIYSSVYVAPPPILELKSPSSNMTEVPVTVASGVTDPYVNLLVNGVHIAVEKNGSFSTPIVLNSGANRITVVATDSAGRSTNVSVVVTYEDPLPHLRDDLKSKENTLLILCIISVAAISTACVMTVLYLSLRNKRTP